MLHVSEIHDVLFPFLFRKALHKSPGKSKELLQIGRGPLQLMDKGLPVQPAVALVQILQIVPDAAAELLDRFLFFRIVLLSPHRLQAGKGQLPEKFRKSAVFPDLLQLLQRAGKL